MESSMSGREIGQSKRELNKIANRRTILNSAMNVFSTRGLDNGTINDIAQDSGLSVGTFYNYFEDKEAVFAELVSSFLMRARVALNRARNEASSLERFISDAFLVYSHVVQADARMQALISKNNHAFRQYVFGGGDIVGIVEDLERDMSEAIVSGLLPEFPVRLMTSAMIGAGAEVFAFDVDRSGASTEEKAQFLALLFLGGIERLSQQHI